jgi:hypothetical protein
MSLYKSAQLVKQEPIVVEPTEVVLYEEMPSKEEVVELTPNNPEMDGKAVQVSFKLPHLPGCDLSDEEVVELTEKPEEKEVVKNEVKDRWSWSEAGHDGFLGWLSGMLKNVPKHSGKSVAGIERAIAYLKKLVGEISKAMQSDLDGKVDADKVQEAYEEIYDGIERLEEALKKMAKGGKKTASHTSAIVKEAQKTTSVGGIIVTVPLIISSIARACVNSMVSNGRDLEDMVKRAIDMYKLNNREQAELYQLLSDMNVYVRRDRLHNFEKGPFDPQSSDNAELGPNYQS